MANEEQLTQLENGSEIWNEWRSKSLRIKIDLRDADLRDADLHNADLHNADLCNADLSDADLCNADFSHADLHSAKMIDTDLSNADLRGAKLRSADLSGANLNDADLRGADLRGAHLIGADLRGAHLIGADLHGAKLRSADLNGADLDDANLSGADLSGANLSGADLSGADLSGTILRGVRLIDAHLGNTDLRSANLINADLHGAKLIGANLSSQNLSNKNLSEADLSGADLSRTLLIGTNFTEAILTDCKVYGIAAWDVQLDRAVQNSLIITQEQEATITIDNLKVAQFVYLLLNNEEIRDVLDTIAKKAVLILGRFTRERKGILDELRETLRSKDYLPILFDFQGPASQDVAGTVSTLAHISRFVIADLTDPSCSPYEIGLIAPCRKPITPIFQPSEKEPGAFSMLKDLRRRHPWILPTYEYTSLEDLLTSLQEQVIDPAEMKVKELEAE